MAAGVGPRPGSASPAAVEAVKKARDRMNMLVLVLPGQWFGLMVLYWGRFLPPLRPYTFHVPAPEPWLLAAGAVFCALPAVLPRSYFRPRAFERGPLYRRLGLRAFRFLATDGELINRRLRRLDPSYRVMASRAALAEHWNGSITNERWHLAFFLLGLLTQVFALASSEYGWAALLTVFNVAFNLYPVMHQRYKRSRLRSLYMQKMP